MELPPPDASYEGQVLDADGRVIDQSLVPDLNDDTFIEMYWWMRFARKFDQKGVSLQRQGRMGTFSATTGHEGALIGSEFALDDEDWIVPYYRDHPATISHGLPPENIYQYYMGHEEGNIVPEGVNVFPISITIAGQLPHATGLAWASSIRESKDVVLTYFGDGATSEGDFHEASNFAGVFDVPLILFCMNNQWAISTPASKQTASETISQKATAYGFDGVRIDGMDPLCVYNATNSAVEKARNPTEKETRTTLIEAVLYRIAAHNTTDDPSNYRDEDKTEEWRRFDPIDRIRGFLLNTGRLDDESIESIENEIDDKIDIIVDKAEASDPNPEEMFDYVYERPTKGLRKQQNYLTEIRNRFGDDELLEEK